MKNLLQEKKENALKSDFTRSEVFEWKKGSDIHCLKHSGDIRFYISTPITKEINYEIRAPEKIPNLKILDTAELAKELKVSESTINNYRRNGKIHGVKLGNGKKASIRYNLFDVWEELKVSNYGSG